jgi:hypothetical protein
MESLCCLTLSRFVSVHLPVYPPIFSYEGYESTLLSVYAICVVPDESTPFVLLRFPYRFPERLFGRRLKKRILYENNIQI